MYVKRANLQIHDGYRVLKEMVEQNVVWWTAMIGECCRRGREEEALLLFRYMQWNARVCPNQFTFASVLPACCALRALQFGKELHRHILLNGYQSNIFVATALVHMYVKCGSIEDARQMFDKMPQRNVVTYNAMIAGCAESGDVEEAEKIFREMPQRNIVSWTAMIASYARHGCDEEALRLFGQMQESGIRPDAMALTTLLPACANLASLQHGKLLHHYAITSGFHSDVFVGTALLDMYVKCGVLEKARKLFDKMPDRNVVSWNSMIMGYAQDANVEEAIGLFEKMPERDVISWNVIITAYAQNGRVDEALNLLEAMPEGSVVSWTAVIAGYARSGSADKVWQLLQKMPKQNVASWTSIIAGCAQSGHFHEALNLFRQMQRTGLQPDSVAFITILPVCGNLAALQHGREIHKDIIFNGFHSDTVVENALIDMYARCACIDDAQKVFNRMLRRNVVSWSAMIIGYAMHGCIKEALQLFKQIEDSAILPNHITFLGVLLACCHAGLVRDGLNYFNSMQQHYHITPSVEHYCCMVDLLGRAGFLDEAEDFISRMPIEPDVAVWGSLLSACRIYTNAKLGELAAEHLFKLDTENASHYVLLANIYATAGMWDRAEKVRKMMKDKKVEKTPGCSWIEVNSNVYTFYVGELE